MDPKIFKAYDIRGIYPSELDPAAAYFIARAYVQFLKRGAPTDKKLKLALGRDVRLSGPSLFKAALEGMLEEGAEVFDIGTISTDMLYYAVPSGGLDGGIAVTASHNPVEYNGMKMIREGAAAISSDTGLFEIRDIALALESASQYKPATELKHAPKLDIVDGYLDHVLSFIDISALKPLRLMLHANFGMAGQFAKQLLAKLPVKMELACLDCEPDGSFPKGRPDPSIPERQVEASQLVKSFRADLGVAWDADADRCFFFDEKGNFIEAYFITALLAEELLAKHPGEKIIHCVRLTWAVDEAVRAAGGIPLVNKVGHTFIKERMRAENALFAGEISAHYYFRDNHYADNGMIPFVMLLEILSKAGKPISEILAPLTSRYFVSGEINTRVKEVAPVLAELEKRYADGTFDKMDGVSVEYPAWRFNVRASNTEPVLRLNVEAREKHLMENKRDELLKLIQAYV